MPATKRNLSPLLTAAAIAKITATRRVHVLNKRAIRHTKSLGDAVGMRDMGVHLVRLAPGDISTEYHTHYCDEEFVYILSGRGVAEIGARKFKVGAGDFIGFTAKSLPHAILNPFKAELVYLLGGTRKAIDISEYPRRDRKSTRLNSSHRL